ncbi:MAG: cytochrome C' [Burkholderiales bacterium]|jgi:cytochrome c|nr:cytochrome C' [Burkholderiales bacterium]
MKLSILVPVALSAAFLAGGAMAQDASALLKSKNCLACHDAQAKKVGPSFKDSAAKYAGNADAANLLFTKLKTGKGADGKSHAVVAASDDDIKAIIAAVLATK